jgi:uncharacterized protein (TIGR02594 family)
MEELLLLVLKHYGIKEVLGPQANPEILAMFAEIGFDWVKDDETAWCSASLNYFCKKLNYQRSGKLDARSWLKVGTEVTTPQLGDIVVYWRNDPNGWEGHVGIYISEDNGMIYTLGGNQGNMLGISTYPKSKVLGYRKLNKL